MGSKEVKCVKVIFHNRQKAHKALRAIQFKGKALRAYECEKCYKWHLTSEVNGKPVNIKTY